MESILIGALTICLFITLWFTWRYLKLQHNLDRYTNELRGKDNLNLPIETLPVEVEGLEDLSNIVNALVSNMNIKLFEKEADRSRLATVLDQLTDGVLIADSNGQVQFANPAACRIFEIPSPIGRTVTEVVRNHQLVEAWHRCQKTNELQSETIEIPSRHQFLQLIVIPDQHASGSLLLAQDFTRIQRLETVRRDFISNISHELRTPLASLKALTETLQNGALSDPEVAPRFLDRMVTEVDALTQMAQELVDLSRIESGQVKLELRTISPNELLLSAAERMKMQAERAGLNLRVDCREGLPDLRVDQSRLEQVLVNLIHNAVKFTHPGGEVILLAEPADNVVQFAVKDSGIGIPVDDIPRIFERFYRVDKSRTGSGTGLGLSIARHIIEAHGGKIWADSVEGQGSTFFFTIPRSL
jgi:two-component system, OmpR family, phosphate regulon sensor histidine kinase PhoR